LRRAAGFATINTPAWSFGALVGDSGFHHCTGFGSASFVDFVPFPATFLFGSFVWADAFAAN
jgi:hypothetical protein